MTSLGAWIRSRAAGRAASVALAALLPVGAVVVLIGSDRSQGNLGVDLRVAGALDPFERADSRNGLGGGPGGQVWRQVAGVWGISAGSAYAVVPDAGRNLAVVPSDAGDGLVEVRLASATGGAGLVFRFQDPENYWTVVAAPSYATWVVTRTVAGESRLMGNTGLSSSGSGTTVGVRLKGSTIDVAVDHRVLKTVRSAELASAPGVGLVVAGPDAGTARFDDFRVEPSGEGGGS